MNDPEVKRVGPESTRILALHADPYPDGKRLKVALELTPFEKRPDIEIVLTDPEGNEASTASVVEPVGWKLELTLHNRQAAPTGGEYHLTARLSYPDLGSIDQRQVVVRLPPAAE